MGGHYKRAGAKHWGRVGKGVHPHLRKRCELRASSPARKVGPGGWRKLEDLGRRGNVSLEGLLGAPKPKLLAYLVTMLGPGPETRSAFLWGSWHHPHTLLTPPHLISSSATTWGNQWRQDL